jgi:hypothetical protein
MTKPRNKELPKTSLDRVKERVGLVSRLIEPNFDITQLRGFSQSNIAKIVCSSDFLYPARSRDGIEKSIQQAQTFLQTQGKILEEIFTIVSRIDEIKGFVDELNGGIEEIEKWNSEFNSIKMLLDHDIRAEFNHYKIFVKDPKEQQVRLKGEDDSRPVSVGRYDVSGFLGPIIKCDDIQALSPAIIRRASNFISELLGKNSAAKMDLRSRFKLLANREKDDEKVNQIQVETHTTWILQLFSYSNPLAVQGNINPDVINQLLS